MVKPDAQGSSLGVSIVSRRGGLSEALRNCFRYDVFALSEQAIPGTEWTVGLIDDEPLPLIQIETPREFFDFAAKYEDDATGCRFDFGVPRTSPRRSSRPASPPPRRSTRGACRGSICGWTNGAARGFWKSIRFPD